MKAKISSICMAVLIILILLSSCSKSSDSSGAKPQERIRITIVTATPGGAQEVTGAAVAEIWKNAIPDVDFSSVPSGGSTSNPALLRQGDGDVGFLTGAAASAALNGEAPYTTTYPELRSMFAFYPNTLQMWSRTDAGVNDMSDLMNGKKATFGNPASGGYQPGLNLMGVFGFTPEDMKKAKGEYIPLTWSEAVDALKDGNIDAVMWQTNYPAAGIVSAQAGNNKIFLVQLNRAKLNEYKNKYPGWVDVTIPAGTYKGQTNDVVTLGTQSMLVVKDTMPEELVYRMTKTLWEAREQLGNVHVLLKDISSETVARGMVVPLHPGAKRFFKEMGFPMDE